MRTPALVHGSAALLLSSLLLLPATGRAQVRSTGPGDAQEWVRGCQGTDHRDREETHCEVRDAELPGSLRRLSVDARRNGGVSVRGWDRNTILVRAKIRTQARSEGAARELASELRLRTADGAISADGPSPGSRESWSVSYEIWVPRASNYDITTESYNGGVSIADVGGTIRAETHNGGISMRNVGGDVRARTHNGGVNVALSGSRWNGAGLDVETRNGGVRIELPEEYNAQLETGTTNGGMRVDFPITVQGRIGRTLNTRIGSGGAPIRVYTTNGSVTVRRS